MIEKNAEEGIKGHSLVLNGEEYKVGIVTSDEDIESIRELTNSTFGEHHGTPLEYLRTIPVHGHVLGVKDASGKFVGEAQIILEPIDSSQAEDIVKNLKPHQAYFEEFGVDPSKQDSGLGKWLMTQVIEIARRAGKTEIYVTVRVENGISSRALINGGYEIIDYDANYYWGDNLVGARMIGRKLLTKDEVSQKDIHMSDVHIFPEEKIDFDKELPETKYVGIVVVDSNNPGEIAHKQLEGLLKRGVCWRESQKAS